MPQPFDEPKEDLAGRTGHLDASGSARASSPGNRPEHGGDAGSALARVGEKRDQQPEFLVDGPGGRLVQPLGDHAHAGTPARAVRRAKPDRPSQRERNPAGDGRPKPGQYARELRPFERPAPLRAGNQAVRRADGSLPPGGSGRAPAGAIPGRVLPERLHASGGGLAASEGPAETRRDPDLAVCCRDPSA